VDRPLRRASIFFFFLRRGAKLLNRTLYGTRTCALCAIRALRIDLKARNPFQRVHRKTVEQRPGPSRAQTPGLAFENLLNSVLKNRFISTAFES
jgi:hypothetical protein